MNRTGLGYRTEMAFIKVRNFLTNGGNMMFSSQNMLQGVTDGHITFESLVVTLCAATRNTKVSVFCPHSILSKVLYKLIYICIYKVS
jgi:hypothetical protein